MVGEEREEVELARRERELARAIGDLARQRIHEERAISSVAGPRDRGARRALSTRHQLARAEGLVRVVVGAVLEPAACPSRRRAR
jgi:hypothetical protein